MDQIEERPGNNPVISVILPIYNQSKDIERIMQTYPVNLDHLNIPWEIIFIVNGSKDDSYARLSSSAKDLPNVHVFESVQSGWGHAVKFGISKSLGQFICYSNSARTDVDDLILILKYALVNENIVLKANRIIRDSFIRKLGSTIYNFEFRLIYRIPVWDINGTPKVIPKKIIRELDLKEDGDLIDAELIFKCRAKNIHFMEVPVVSTKRFHGKSTTKFSSALRMYYGLLFLKKNL